MKFNIKYGTILLLGCLTGIPRMSQAQAAASGKYFIYIQDQGGTPFYLRSGDSLLSSTPSGYMIIPGLAKGTYQLTIGFPRNEAPEASFKVSLDGSGDKGYLLRKDEKGLLKLYALKDFKPLAPTAVASAPGNRIVDVPTEVVPTSRPAVQPDGKTAAKKPEPAPAATAAAPAQEPADDTDAFSRMLNEITGTTTPAKTTASAVGESAKPSSAETPEAPVSSAAVSSPVTPSQQDTGSEHPVAAETETAPEQQTSGAGDVATQPSQPQSEPEPQFITFQPDSEPREVKKEDTEAVSPPGAVISDVYQTIDTAAAARREERKMQRQQRRAEKEADRQASFQADSLLNAPSVAISAPSGPEEVTSGETADTARMTDKRPLKVNSDCQQLVSAQEFQKVRRKMASRSDEAGMFRIGQKYLTDGGSCFLTGQIQSLTYLFLTDEYKYRFLELAYPHTADPAQFGKLEKTLGTDYYRKRFEAMIR